MKKIFLYGGAFILLFGGLSFAKAAEAATLSLIPASGSYGIGDLVTIRVLVSSPDQAMNAVSGTLSFPTDKLQAVSTSKIGSMIGVWAEEPSFSNFAGTVRFEGVVLNPGFTGSAGQVVTVTFKVRATGTAVIKWSEGAVLANDGQGTNILTNSSGSSFTTSESEATPSPQQAPGIEATPAAASGPKPLVASKTHQDAEWSNAPGFEASWAVPESVKAVYYGVFESSKVQPFTSKKLATNAVYNLDAFGEGVRYFSVRFETKEGFGPTATFKIQFDATPPAMFQVRRDDGAPTSPRPLLAFETSDALSGLNRYEMKIDGGGWMDAKDLQETRGLYRLPALRPGAHTVVVRAFDYAGNSRESEVGVTVEAIAGPVIQTYTERVSPPGDPFIARGTALPKATVHLALRNGEQEILFSTAASEDGYWTAAYDKRLPAGEYEFSAWAEDATGAQSLETTPQLLRATSWLKDKSIAIGEYTLFGILVLFGLFGVIATFLFTRARLLMFHKKLKANIAQFETRLEKDVVRLEADIKKPRVGRERLSSDAEKIWGDVEDEANELRKM